MSPDPEDGDRPNPRTEDPETGGEPRPPSRRMTSIFRSRAVESYVRRREETTLPRLASPRWLLVLWLLVLALAAGSLLTGAALDRATADTPSPHVRRPVD